MARPDKCANNTCSAVCHHGDGKLFRLDLEVGNKSGDSDCQTIYIWLCTRCASQMNPKVTIVGETVRVLLASIHPPPVRSSSLPAWVN